jgi:hypothetical protein
MMNKRRDFIRSLIAAPLVFARPEVKAATFPRPDLPMRDFSNEMASVIEMHEGSIGPVGSGTVQRTLFIKEARNLNAEADLDPDTFLFLARFRKPESLLRALENGQAKDGDLYWYCACGVWGFVRGDDTCWTVLSRKKEEHQAQAVLSFSLRLAGYLSVVKPELAKPLPREVYGPGHVPNLRGL